MQLFVTELSTFANVTGESCESSLCVCVHCHSQASTNHPTVHAPQAAANNDSIMMHDTALQHHCSNNTITKDCCNGNQEEKIGCT